MQTNYNPEGIWIGRLRRIIFVVIPAPQATAGFTIGVMEEDHFH